MRSGAAAAALPGSAARGTPEAGGGWKSAPSSAASRSAVSTRRPGQRMASRSRALKSSRTLPCHAHAASRSSCASASRGGGEPRRCFTRARPQHTRAGRSSGRARSGGISRWTTQRRKYRSARKRPAHTSRRRSRLVAATTRAVMASDSFPPTRSYSRSWSTRSSSACSFGSSSPISSRKIVPRAARSKRPARRASAPVNAPRSCPKSSLSISEGASEAQSAWTKAPRRRGEARCSTRATSPLPTPVSPVSSAVVSRAATCAMERRSARIAALSPAISRAIQPRASSVTAPPFRPTPESAHTAPAQAGTVRARRRRGRVRALHHPMRSAESGNQESAAGRRPQAQTPANGAAVRAYGQRPRSKASKAGEPEPLAAMCSGSPCGSPRPRACDRRRR